MVGIAVVNALTALLAAVLAFAWCRGARETAVQWTATLLMAGGITLAAFICGWAVAHLILRPGLRFAQQAAEMLTMAGDESLPERPRLAAVFDCVTRYWAGMGNRPFFPEFICSSPQMRAVLRQVRMLAPTGINVLVSGEDGTGKTLAAQAIHTRSPRRKGPLVHLDCTLRPPDRLARDLFGGRDMAPADTPTRPGGAVAQARGGTLLLENVAALPKALQIRLREVIDTAGDDREAFGLIGTSCHDLNNCVSTGHFDQELYAQLAQLEIQLPPLRTRIEDLGPLAAHFRPDDGENGTLTASALQTLIGYGWPGNVKEFRGVIEVACARSGGRAIDRVHLPAAVRAVGRWLPAADSTGAPPSIDDRLQTIEKQMIEAALRQTAGIQVRAAELMGINQRSLWHRIKKYGIDAAGFKQKGPRPGQSD